MDRYEIKIVVQEPTPDINKPRRVEQWVCPTCGKIFVKAPRCPECGQLIAKEE